MKRIRPVTVLLVALILFLGYTLVVGQRREARLREALALYRSRNQVQLERFLRTAPLQFGWPNGTPLSQAIDEIRVVTTGLTAFSNGLPIVVDADGLREAGQSLGSPLGPPPPDNLTGGGSAGGQSPVILPLGEKLRIVLEPLGLAAEVKDGVVVITSRARVAPTPPGAATHEDPDP
jgi:hypothetical protein